jgi:putative endonuclease
MSTRPAGPATARRWCAYLLWCSDGSLYAGATNDLVARISTHNAGKGARYTRSRRPVRLARAFYRPNRSAALKWEAAIKRLPRAEKLRLLAMKKIQPTTSQKARSGKG